MKSVAHYTLQAKSCVFAKQKEKDSKIVLSFYTIKKIPMGRAVIKRSFLVYGVMFYLTINPPSSARKLEE